MFMPSLRHTGTLVLVVISAFSQVLNAYDISSKKGPQGSLGVTLDYSLATSWPEDKDPTKTQFERSWVFSSHITFANSVDGITDEQLWQVARDAVTEMEDDSRQYQISIKKIPNAMAVLAWGNEIILASSQKTMPSFAYQYADTPVLESLKLCQMVWRDNAPSGTDERHRAEGMCAEPVAAQLYYSINTNQLQGQNARVGTWVRNRKGEWQKQDPCGEPSRDLWGCNLFTTDQNLRVLDKNMQEAPYDLSNLAGGVSTRDQVQLCSVVRAGV
ncbi:hypothetical protein B0J13DRAFT_453729 [Dactylonectria estremocensis]|uniref:Uncharacterized protein n=1 Tax=Dactylonectria estremocensis TaxID=1079267 RepID=A0A9P9DYB5_9HYPO|nr:hypothetical protein B0J13DRAFT_453729 [Dactylonectria estremocensis]